MPQVQRQLRFGHTAITWDDSRIEDAIRTIAELGYYSIEMFSWTLNALREAGRLGLFEKYDIPLASSYFSVDIVNSSARESELRKLSDWGALLRSLGGSAATLGGNGVDRRSYAFSEHMPYIVDTVNEMGKRLADVGVQPNFHPHTGTPVETEQEIRGLLSNVDDSVIGFAPDVGQIQKGGCDPLTILEDYFSMVRLVHLKDFGGTLEFDSEGKEIDTTGFACYTPLGRGVVNLPAILDMLEDSNFDGYIMVELDPGESMPATPEHVVRENREYLESLGYRFRPHA